MYTFSYKNKDNNIICIIQINYVSLKLLLIHKCVPIMKYSEERIKDNLTSIGFLYDEELIVPNPHGCVIYIMNSEEHQWISIKFKPLNNHRILLKEHKNFKPKVLKHKVGRIIWNNQIKKKNNIKLLMDKI